MLQYGGLVGGIVTISATGPQLVAGPPYLWGQNAGAINAGGIIGTAIGAIYTYFSVDWSITRQAAKDARGTGKGYAEPESRLLTMLPGLFVATTGLWVFGFSAQYPGGKNWVGLEFGLGMLAFGLMQVPSVGFNYVSFHPLSGRLIRANVANWILDYRSVQCRQRGLLRDDHNIKSCNFFCLDFLRQYMGSRSRASTAIRNLWHAARNIFVADDSNVVLRKADQDCNS